MATTNEMYVIQAEWKLRAMESRVKPSVHDASELILLLRDTVDMIVLVTRQAFDNMIRSGFTDNEYGLLRLAGMFATFFKGD